MTPEEAIKFAQATMLEPVLALIQSDPHQWSERGCQTCTSISAIAGKDFGCVKRRAERKVRPQ